MRASLLAILLLASPLAAMAGDETPAPTNERRSSVLLLGRVAGSESYVQQGDEHIARYKFDDRGRGPNLEVRWRLDARQLPTSVRITGVDYLKAPVDEWYTNERAVANWKSSAEQGSIAGAHEHFYLPIESPPSFVGVLAHALLADADGEIELLPGGKARISEALTIPEPGAKGRRKRELIAYEISGIGFSPELVWFDADGVYLGQVGEWLSVLSEGREAWLQPLLEAQARHERARAEDWAKRYAHRHDDALLIEGATVFDSRSGLAREASVLVVGKRIVAVGDQTQMAFPEKIERLDARGRWLLPGLWDNHVHLGGVDGVLHLAAGVTSVRDLANDEASLPDRIERIRKGEELGPRVLAAGFMDGSGPYAGPTRVLIDSAEDAEKWVEWYAQHGYEQIKVYSSLKPELVPLIARLAHARGLRLSGHVPATMSAEQFVAAGADEIQHLNFIFLNFLMKEAPDTRDMTRFTAIGRYAHTIDPENERERTFIALLANQRIVVDPTINLFENFFEAKAGEIGPGYRGIAARLPPQVQRELRLGGLKPPAGQEKNYAEAFPSMLRMLAALHQAGVPIVPGTDAMAGFALLRELELYEAAGIPRADILRMATLGSAEVNRRAHELGVIAPGWYADLILLDADPMQSISALRRVRRVIKDGVSYLPDELYAAVGVKPDP
ncbi:MAG: amidohydrolase family protein [Xanthomonadales bacterium]|nr:Adenine deaminase [Xanthomonadales bacterium]MCC6594585.1 amidohydrolase family protein [Xanthomonadales bacterium]MCE7932298.1 hypothetical protein [Xanthomonadales bacterium PRO6]